jgi:class 3 adenylate cyclase
MEKPIRAFDETLASRVARNFFTHSGHVPLTLLILELLLARPGYFTEPDPYLLLSAGLIQAWVAEWLASRDRPSPFLSNLVGPLFYSVVEAGMEGLMFFRQWHHQAYWTLALGFGLLHWLQFRRANPVPALVLAENILRAAIPLVMYAIFETLASDGRKIFGNFFDDSAHTFLAIVLLLLGALLGFGDLNLRRSQATIRALTARLRQYSEWSLGRGILDRAIADERTLALQRVDRAVLFMDIRGFTAWSEKQTPEAVVGMLNAYYRAAEASLGELLPIKIKYTADEVMAVFPDALSAIDAGRRMLAATRALLEESGLAVGAGIHLGTVVEGVLGAEGSKAYDFIGDTVNTAQRLCDAATAGELLVSATACEAASISPESWRAISAKGKQEPLKAASIE